MNTTTTYNGWKNRQTWNVSLWIGNDEGLYRSACEFMHRYTGRAPYRMFIQDMGLTDDKTPDGIKWMSQVLDLPRLNEMMKELIS